MCPGFSRVVTEDDEDSHYSTWISGEPTRYKKDQTFLWRSTSGNERCFRKEDCDEWLIEVFGRCTPKIIGSERVLFQPVIATLKGEDAEIYRKLQVKDGSRHHPVSNIILLYMFLRAFYFLLATFFVSGLFLLNEENIAWRAVYSLLMSMPLAAFGAVALLFIGTWVLILWGYGRVLIYTIGVMKKLQRGAGYYRDLFTTLSSASNHDKAEAAQLMAYIFAVMARAGL